MKNKEHKVFIVAIALLIFFVLTSASRAYRYDYFNQNSSTKVNIINQAKPAEKDITKSVDIFSVNRKYIKNLDLRKPCGLSETELEAAMLLELKQYSKDFLKAERHYGVNAVFLAAVAGLESGWGTSLWAQRNNIFGFAYGKEYPSISDCINKVAKALKTDYLSFDGIYYNGYTVEDVNIYYSLYDDLTINSDWCDSVETIMVEIYRRAEKYILKKE